MIIGRRNINIGRTIPAVAYNPLKRNVRLERLVGAGAAETLLAAIAREAHACLATTTLVAEVRHGEVGLLRLLQSVPVGLDLFIFFLGRVLLSSTENYELMLNATKYHSQFDALDDKRASCLYSVHKLRYVSHVMPTTSCASFCVHVTKYRILCRFVLPFLSAAPSLRQGLHAPQTFPVDRPPAHTAGLTRSPPVWVIYVGFLSFFCLRI